MLSCIGLWWLQLCCVDFYSIYDYHILGSFLFHLNSLWLIFLLFAWFSILQIVLMRVGHIRWKYKKNERIFLFFACSLSSLVSMCQLKSCQMSMAVLLSRSPSIATLFLSIVSAACLSMCVYFEWYIQSHCVIYYDTTHNQFTCDVDCTTCQFQCIRK